MRIRAVNIAFVVDLPSLSFDFSVFFILFQTVILLTATQTSLPYDDRSLKRQLPDADADLEELLPALKHRVLSTDVSDDAFLPADAATSSLTVANGGLTMSAAPAATVAVVGARSALAAEDARNALVVTSIYAAKVFIFSYTACDSASELMSDCCLPIADTQPETCAAVRRSQLPFK